MSGGAAAVFLIVAAALLLFMQNVNSTGSGSSGEGLSVSGSGAAPPPPSPLIGAISTAIATAENVPENANNPGALALGDLGLGTLNSAGVTIFDTLERGWTNLYAQLGKIFSGADALWNEKASELFGVSNATDLTISQFAQIWTGNDNPAGWAQTVADHLGVSVDTPISQLGGS